VNEGISGTAGTLASLQTIVLISDRRVWKL